MEIDAGLLLLKTFLTNAEQKLMVYEMRQCLRASPLFRPTLKNGRPFRYRMSNCGQLGWIADERGYRYTPIDPRVNRPWPAMPESVRETALKAAALAGDGLFMPESCLINFYANERENLGIHQDSTEKNLRAPIISISLGDSGVFSVGGMGRSEPTHDIILHSGDVLVMAGESRNRFHAFKRVLYGSSNLLRNHGRLNLTIRQVN